MKNNLAPPPASLAFEFVGSRIEWQSTPVNLSAESLLSPPPNSEELSEQEDVAEFLRDLLSDGSIAAKDVFKAAHENGFSEATVKRTKRRIGIESTKVGQPGSKNAQWYWSLPLPLSAAPTATAHEQIESAIVEEVF